MSDQTVLDTALKRYARAKEYWSEFRRRAVEDLEFSNPADPKQWDEAAVRMRKSGNQPRPCLTLDHTNQYIAQVVNDARQNKPGLSFLPSTGGARIEVARALDGLARHIEYRSRAQIAYDTAIESAARIGLGWISLNPEVVDPVMNHQEVRVCRHHDPLAVIPDPDWTEPDGSDMRYVFVESSLPREEFRAQWPDADESAWEGGNDLSGWVTKDTVRVCDYYSIEERSENLLIVESPDGLRQSIREDELQAEHTVVSKSRQKTRRVVVRTITSAHVLEEAEFPARWIPVVPVIGHELWIQGKRHLSGMVRRMREAQKAYNYERTAWVEAVALQPKAPFLVDAESIEGHEDSWSKLNRENLAYLPFNARDHEGNALPMPQRMAPPALPTAFAQGAAAADSDIQAAVGMYRASIGAPSNEKSGRAIMARQREGDVANFHYVDNLSRSIEHVGRIMLDMIVRLYDEPREARILGADGMSKPVKITPDGDPYAVNGDQTTINPGTGTYDVRVKSGPGYTTLRQEAADALTEMMGRSPQMAAVVGPVWAQMQDWPEADKLAKALLAMSPPPVQQALQDGSQGQDDPERLKAQLQQLEQQSQAMSHAMEQATQQLAQLKAEAEGKRLEHVARAAEIEIREYEAETKRLQVMGAGMSVEQVQTVVMQMLHDLMTRNAGVPEAGEPPHAMPEPGEMPADEQAEHTEFMPEASPEMAEGAPDLAQEPAMNEGSDV